MWADIVLVAKVGGTLIVCVIACEIVYMCFDLAGKTWRQRQIDEIVAENARYARREERLRTWRKRDLTDEEQASAARRMALVMESSTKRVQ